MSTAPTKMYRSLLRELRLASLNPRATRNPTVQNHIRALVQEAKPDEAERTLLEARDFLRSVRIHKELLERYNPTHGMTQEERVHATARRVGLDSPVEYKKDE